MFYGPMYANRVFANAMFPSPLFALGTLFVWLLPLVILDLILKAYALWKAGRNNQPIWFIALCLINSLGILPVLYLVFFQKGTAVQSGTQSIQPATRAANRSGSVRRRKK